MAFVVPTKTPGVGTSYGSGGTQSVVTGTNPITGGNYGSGGGSSGGSSSRGRSSRGGGGSSGNAAAAAAAAAKAKYEADQAAAKLARERKAAEQDKIYEKIKGGEISSVQEKTVLQAVKQVGSNILYNLKGSTKGFLTGTTEPTQVINNYYDPFVQPSFKEQLVGGQPKTNEFYLGDTTIVMSDKGKSSSTLGGSGTSTTSFTRTEEIKPNYEKNIIKRIEERIPGAGIPITSLNKNVYVPDANSFSTYGKLIEEGNANKLNRFLADQEAQLKKDIGRYNLLISYPDKTQEDIDEINNLANKINLGNKGTTYDILQNKAVEMESRGENLKFFGRDIKPGVALGSLYGLTTAYQVEKEVLGFQVTGGIAGGILGRSATGLKILKGVEKVSKPFNKLVVPTGFGIGVSSGISTFNETGYLPYAVGAGVGSTLGFFGSVYSKEVVGGGKKLINAIDKYFIQLPEEQTLYFVGGGTQPKTKTKQILEKKEGKKVVKKEIQNYLETEITIKYDPQQGRNIQVIKDVSAMSYNEKAAKAKRLLDELVKNGKATPENIDKLNRLLKESYGEGFVKDFVQQEGIQYSRPIKPTSGTNQFFGIQETQPVVKTNVTSKTLSRSFSNLLSGSSSVSGLRDRTETKSSQEFRPLSASILISKSAQENNQESKQGQESISSLISGQVPQPPRPQPPTPLPGFGNIGRANYPGERIPKEPKVPQPFGFGLPERKKKKVDNKPYDAEVLIDSTKGKKRWLKVADNVNRTTALSIGGRIVDNTESAQFRIVPQKKGKVSAVVDVAWESLQNKFREYASKGNVKVGLKNRYIEKQRYRLDSPSEVSKVRGSRGVSIAGRFGRV